MGKIQAWHQKIFKHFNDFQNWTLSVLWLQSTQTVAMKQNETFFHETYSNLTLFFIGHKILKLFQWLKVKLNCKSGGIFSYLQRDTLFKWLSKFNSW